jgi:hypothetical protein
MDRVADLLRDRHRVFVLVVVSVPVDHDGICRSAR